MVLLVSYLTNLCLLPSHRIFSSFLLEVFVVLALTLRSIILFKCISIYGLNEESKLIFLYTSDQLTWEH